MDVRHLRYFLTVAEETSFTAAADALYVAQPALSQQIRRLESELGVELFQRTTRRVELSAAGRDLVPFARRTVQALDATASRARMLASGDCGLLRVGFATSLAFGLLPRILRTYAAAFPAVRVELSELTTLRQVEALLAGDLDIGIGRDLPSDGGITSRVLLHDSLVVAVPAAHRCAESGPLSFAELADEQFVMLHKDDAPHLSHLIAATCRRAGFDLHPVMEARQFTTLLGLVAAGIGIGIVPESVTVFRPEGLVYRPLDEEVTSEVEMLTAPCSLPPAAQRFLDLCFSEVSLPAHALGTRDGS